MSRIRKLVGVLCLTLALGYAAFALLGQIIRPAPDRYASIYPMGELPPVMCFNEDSVVNAGTAKDLDRLPNIGPVLSQRIIEYREKWGDYLIPEELALVKGIGEKTVQGIAEALTDTLVPVFPGTEAEK